MIKNPTGDSMSKAPSLVDLFANRKDALAKTGQPADAGKAAARRSSRIDSLPLEPAGKKPESGINPSFQTRVKESRAKLASGSHKFFDQGKSGESRRNDQASEARSGAVAKAARAKGEAHTPPEGPRGTDHDRGGDSRTVRKQARGEVDSSGSRAQEASGGRGMDAGRRSADRPPNAPQDMEGTYSADGASVPESGTANASDASAAWRSEGPGQGPDIRSEAAIEELESGLESLGITVTREQLDDPAFLADMLEMLQKMGGSLAVDAAEGETATPPSLQADTAEGTRPTAGQDFPAMDADAEMPDSPSASMAPSSDAKAPRAATTEKLMEEAAGQPAEAVPEEGEGSLSRKEVAALIRDRIAELTRNLSDEAGSASARQANAPATTPGAWQGVMVRPHKESLGADPLPMADLDRLRVLQASALQAGATGKDNAPTLALETDAEVSDGSEGGKTAYLPSTEGSDAAEGEADPGSYGRKEESFKNPDLAVRKEPSALTKEGAPGPQFANALDQARAPENRSAVQRAWSPHQPAFEKSVLDQISRKMSGMGLKSGEELSIQLAPENLGKVRISLELKEGVMSARIGVENESVRQAVESNLAGLRESLEASGVKLQGLNVSVDQRHGSLFNPDGSNAESFFRQQGREGRAGNGGAETAPFESAPESDTGRRLGYNTLEYIG